MRVLVVNNEHKLELRDIPQPRITPFEALVKIKACGICSTTDNEIIRGTQPYHKGYPCLLGHEAVGDAAGRHLAGNVPRWPDQRMGRFRRVWNRARWPGNGKSRRFVHAR